MSRQLQGLYQVETNFDKSQMTVWFGAHGKRHPVFEVKEENEAERTRKQKLERPGLNTFLLTLG